MYTMYLLLNYGKIIVIGFEINQWKKEICMHPFIAVNI